MYKVVSPLKLDGERREVDEEIEMTAKVAAPLLKSGSLVEKPAEKPASTGGLLDGSVGDIVKAIAARDEHGVPLMSDADLQALLDAEGKGKKRKSLLDAIAEEQRSRAASNQ